GFVAMDKLLFWGALVLAVVFLLLACAYWFIPEGSFPPFLAGFTEWSSPAHVRHGFIAFVLAFVLLGLADYLRPFQPSSNSPRGNALPDRQPPGLYLFLVGLLVLFLELACIRWFAAYVVFLQFFTNVAL